MFLFFKIIFIFTLSTFSYSKECFNFVAHQGSEIIAEVLEKALLKRNECLKVKYVPGKRATLELESGKYDGELGRISDYKKEVGAFAVMIPVPIFKANGILVSEKSLTKEDLKNYSGTVGVIRGWKWMEEVLAANNIKNKLVVKSFEDIVNVYNRDRISAFLIPENSLAISNVGRQNFRLPIYDINLYVWLHISKKEKLNYFSEILRENN